MLAGARAPRSAEQLGGEAVSERAPVNPAARAEGFLAQPLRETPPYGEAPHVVRPFIAQLAVLTPRPARLCMERLQAFRLSVQLWNKINIKEFNTEILKT